MVAPVNPLHTITNVPGTTVIHVITVVPGTFVIHGITVVPGTRVIAVIVGSRITSVRMFF